jgi:YidC/Oxa1 family membrane protein insertase
MARTRSTLYAGPQEQDKLEKVAPGLELVVDYGWLTVIAAPLFWVLGAIHKLVGNWGWAIMGLTLLLKLAFFPLSAASYKSMAKMRVLTPKLMKLKEAYGDDKQRLNQEMMALYKREKVNPLGGCLPVLVQIPVFIALYWVLLGTVEMRNAPWLGWITDLSVKDPYYVLPLIMGATMFIQTKLNPTPPDPIQAKVMLLHADGVYWHVPVLPGRSGSLLDGEQHPFDCAAMANHPSRRGRGEEVVALPGRERPGRSSAPVALNQEAGWDSRAPESLPPSPRLPAVAALAWCAFPAPACCPLPR